MEVAVADRCPGGGWRAVRRQPVDDGAEAGTAERAPLQLREVPFRPMQQHCPSALAQCLGDRIRVEPVQGGVGLGQHVGHGLERREHHELSRQVLHDDERPSEDRQVRAGRVDPGGRAPGAGEHVLNEALAQRPTRAVDLGKEPQDQWPLQLGWAAAQLEPVGVGIGAALHPGRRGRIDESIASVCVPKVRQQTPREVGELRLRAGVLGPGGADEVRERGRRSVCRRGHSRAPASPTILGGTWRHGSATTISASRPPAPCAMRVGPARERRFGAGRSRRRWPRSWREHRGRVPVPSGARCSFTRTGPVATRPGGAQGRRRPRRAP